MNARLTLFIPVRDRADYLERLLVYLDLTGCSYPLLICDGSLTSESEEVVYTFCAVANLSIVYQKFEPDLTVLDYAHKVARASQMITTKYVAWICDDDFPVLEELERAIDYLDLHPDYASYSGEVVDFNVLPRFGTTDRCYGYPWITEKNRWCSGRYSLKRSVVDKDRLERLIRVDRVMPIEAIHRSEILREALKIFDKINVTDVMSVNFAIAVAALNAGNYYVSDTVLLLRQDNTPGSAGTSVNMISPAQTQREFGTIAGQLLAPFISGDQLTHLVQEMTGGSPQQDNAGSLQQIFKPVVVRLGVLRRVVTISSLYMRIAVAKLSGGVRTNPAPLVDQTIAKNLGAAICTVAKLLRQGNRNVRQDQMIG